MELFPAPIFGGRGSQTEEAGEAGKPVLGADEIARSFISDEQGPHLEVPLPQAGGSAY